MEEIKDIVEILELAKEEIENNNENITATLDLQDLKSLKNLYDLYQAEKEKNKELEDCLQMAKQIMTVDISEDFDYMELEQFKKYLLNEIKTNENLEE